MKTLKLLLAGAAVGVILLAFRDYERGGWIVPALPFGGADDEDDDQEEPVLGYDGMDVDSLILWLADARPDLATLSRMHAYESAHLAREAVLDEIADRLR
jgi:hypothetical protein